MKKNYILLLCLCLILLTINYSTINSYIIKTFDETETGIVTRIIDGDTIVINNETIRLLGINSPEKGEKYYLESKNFLEKNILNKEVQIQFGKEKYDLYGRKLAYIFYANENINLKSVENGFSNFYFPKGKDKYFSTFKNAWEICLNTNINLCEKSQNKCINVTTWNIETQTLIIKNTCNQSINLTKWSIKDEGRKKYTFENKIISSEEEIKLTEKNWNETYVWTRTGDSIFIRDSEGKLVYFKNY